MKIPTKKTISIPTLLEYAKEQKQVGRKEREKEIIELLIKEKVFCGCPICDDIVKKIKEQKSKC